MDALDDVAPAFVAMAHRIVWCTVATLDGTGRPRTCILHPVWTWDGERLDGWIATSPTTVKLAGIEASPSASLTYWDPSHDTCTADCTVRWITDDDERVALWDRLRDAPAPVGYDPAIIPPWAGGPTSPAFSGWHLDPHRLRVMPGTLMLEGTGRLHTWRR